MAKKNVPESFVIDEKKKIIMLYKDVIATETEKYLIEIYLKNGYSPRIADKPQKEGIPEMEKTLSQYDKKHGTNYANIFSGIYRPTEKGGDTYEYSYPVGKEAEQTSGFFGAIAFYNAWKKAQKDDEKESVKANVKTIENGKPKQEESKANET